MNRILILAALLALSSQADAQRRGGNVSGYDPQAPRMGGGNDVLPQNVPQWRGWGGKRGLGGTDPCCAEDPGQQPRK